MNGIISGKIDSEAKKFNRLSGISSSYFTNNKIYVIISTPTWEAPKLEVPYEGEAENIYVEITGQGNKNNPLYIPLFCAFYAENGEPTYIEKTLLRMYEEDGSVSNLRYDTHARYFYYSYNYKEGKIFLEMKLGLPLSLSISSVRIGTFS